LSLHWLNIALVAALVAAGCAAAFALLRKFRQNAADNRRQVASLTESVQALKTRLAQLDPDLPSAELAASPETAPPEQESISSEIQAVITAAAVALLGHNVSLRSARLLSSQASASPWSQQGRVIVQTSHNLGSRRR
jgi:hypothetical protein